MKLKKILISIFLMSFTATVFAADTVTIIDDVPYAAGAKVKNKIREKCTALGTKLSSFTQSYAGEQGITVEMSETIDTASQGKVLHLEITHAVSKGNAFIGHKKSVDIAGTLWENNKKIASFTGNRHSGGGFAAGFKGSCSVLGRCVKALGKDIAIWLKDPEDGEHLGD